MKNKVQETAIRLAKSVTRHLAPKAFAVGLAGMSLVCIGLCTAAQAQTSVTCDAAGDAIYGSGKGGPAVPPWLDITQSTITDAGDSILFTLTLTAAIPTAPAWNGVDDGGQIWWGWRMVNDSANINLVANGCVAAKGRKIPAGYFVDLIWNVQTASFTARLLDDSLCVASAVPFAFSPDRTQVTLLVSKSLFANATLIPNPNAFQYFATTLTWKATSIGNTSFYTIDQAPDSGWSSWSSSSSTTYGCP